MCHVEREIDAGHPRPVDAIRRWPRTRALAALVSDGRGSPDWARWSFLASPEGALVHDHAPAGGRTRWIPLRADAPCPIEPSHDPLADLDRARDAAMALAHPVGSDHPTPFPSGWIGCLEYELGGVMEPAAAPVHGRSPGRLWTLLWCPTVASWDGREHRWLHPGALPALHSGAAPSPAPPGPMDSTTGQPRYEQMVRRTIEYIHAGDLFQANIAHRLAGPFLADARAASAGLLEASRAWYGAHVELPGTRPRTVVSLSPELLLQYEHASRTGVTRPMKGTAEARTGAQSLRDSAKDEAELVMIVDLMRNDLGRIAEPGSVRVLERRVIETHGPAARPVLQGVATVGATVRRGVNLGEIIRGIFPAGSITGAPKIRAMQIIDELEQEARGAFCGSVGYVSSSGDMCWNVAIRTATIGADRIEFPVGAGIVAQSDPSKEWDETLIKAGLLVARDAGAPAETAA